MTPASDYQPPANGFRTFVLVWLTQSVSFLGTMVGWFALTVWLSQQATTQEALGAALATLGLVNTVPTVFLAPLAGAWADRHDRKLTMLGADVLSGLLSILTFWLLLNSLLTFPTLLVISFIFPLLGAFHSAAFDTSYAMLLRDDQLPRANGMMQTVWSLGGIIAPGLAALMIALPLGLAGTMLADAVSFLLAAAVLPFLTIPSPRRTDLAQAGGPGKSLWADIVEGARFIWRRRPILWLLGTFTVANFCGTAVFVLLPVMVRFQLAPSAELLGLDFTRSLATVQTAGSVGGVIGGIVISVWGGLKRRRALGVVVPILLSGLMQVAVGWSVLLPVSLAVFFVQAAMVPIMNSHSQSVWQITTPRELQGRVFSVRRLIAWISNPVSTLVAGAATARGVEAGVLISALGVVIVVWCIANLFNQMLLRVDEPGYLDHFAAARGG